MGDATGIPVLVDGNSSGFGNFNSGRSPAKKLEQRGAWGGAIEDKGFPKIIPPSATAAAG